MATQFTVRSFGHKHNLELKSVTYDGVDISRVRENGFMVFEISDPDVVIELVVKRKIGSAADAKPSASPKSPMTTSTTSQSASKSARTKTTGVSSARQKLLDSKWTARYDELVAFKRQHGHTDVPPKTNRQLARWIAYQRDDKFGRLTKERALKLHKLGVKLQSREEAWSERYNELVLYQRRHGDCLVPREYWEAPKLRKFVDVQRQMIQLGTLKPDRLKLLNDIGFCRNARESRWQMRFEELTQYWQEHGHCEVPQKYQETPGLGDWVIEVCVGNIGPLFYY